MKRLFYVFSIALIAAMFISAAGATPTYAGPDKTVRMLVEYNLGQKSQASSALQAVGARVIHTFDRLNAFAVEVPGRAVQTLGYNPAIVTIEEDPIRYTDKATRCDADIAAAVTDLMAGTQVVPYGIDMVQAREVWDADLDDVVDAGAPDGTGVNVCVIDTGVYTLHEDLVDVNFLGGDPADWDSDGYGHGTHVTGTITAVNNGVGVVGVTPGTVNMFHVRVFDDAGDWSYASDLVDAAYVCYDEGDSNIISMSLSGPVASSIEKKGFDDLYYNLGVLHIAAASNYHDPTKTSDPIRYPAGYASVVSVAAVDNTMAIADFSQQNRDVEIAAPGVGVLSTVPWFSDVNVNVDGVDYDTVSVEYAANGTVTANLVDGGLCLAGDAAWSGLVVLCQRGSASFYDKVMNVQNSGGLAAVLYNNTAGYLYATLGDGNSSTIPAVSLLQADGQYLVANKLGMAATVTNIYSVPGSSYEAWDGTSMATPHVAGVAALLWSAFPFASNQEIRDAMNATALDQGAVGRDQAFGYGIVQAKDALDYLPAILAASYHVEDLSGSSAVFDLKSWQASVTITVLDGLGAPVPDVTVSGVWKGGGGGKGLCITDAAGQCTIVSRKIGNKRLFVTFQLKKLTSALLTYNPKANKEFTIIVNKP